MVVVKRMVGAVLLASFLLLGTYYATAILDLRETVTINQFGVVLLGVSLILAVVAYFLDQLIEKVMGFFEGDWVQVTVVVMITIVMSVVVAELISLFVK